MFNSPWDKSPLSHQPDDPSPRIIPLGPARPQGGCDSPTARPANVHDRTRRAIEARLNADAHIQTLRHRVIPDLTWRDDLADLWDDIRSQPLSHAVVGVVGFIVGTFGILALAELAVRL